jgi:hypothetical protein
MYRIFNWLFGWDYVLWNSDWTSGISRVNVSKDGRLWYWTEMPLVYEAKELYNPAKVMWLTCHPTKYFPKTFKSNNNGTD